MATSDRSLIVLARNAHPDLVLKVDVDGAVRGTLEAYRLPNGHAEIGLSVEDEYQGQGIGKELFWRGLQALMGMDVTSARLFFSAQNDGV
ncbi:GNAT family N-acetyltransferase, partial [Loktanella sp. DJP18]|uniref:GNAT family N-acetyltransferase n=1 Tax=Loktanella sp. DJP18 TaxID=3409788 RepID=UPI003BB56709